MLKTASHAAHMHCNRRSNRPSAKANRTKVQPERIALDPWAESSSFRPPHPFKAFTVFFLGQFRLRWSPQQFQQPVFDPRLTSCGCGHGFPPSLDLPAETDLPSPDSPLDLLRNPYLGTPNSDRDRPSHPQHNGTGQVPSRSAFSTPIAPTGCRPAMKLNSLFPRHCIFWMSNISDEKCLHISPLRSLFGLNALRAPEQSNLRCPAGIGSFNSLLGVVPTTQPLTAKALASTATRVRHHSFASPDNTSALAQPCAHWPRPSSARSSLALSALRFPYEGSQCHPEPPLCSARTNASSSLTPSPKVLDITVNFPPVTEPVPSNNFEVSAHHGQFRLRWSPPQFQQPVFDRDSPVVDAAMVSTRLDLPAETDLPSPDSPLDLFESLPWDPEPATSTKPSAAAMALDNTSAWHSLVLTGRDLLQQGQVLLECIVFLTKGLNVIPSRHLQRKDQCLKFLNPSPKCFCHRPWPRCCPPCDHEDRYADEPSHPNRALIPIVTGVNFKPNIPPVRPAFDQGS
nr:hypothetical protein Iba_chr01bCG3620 [Ipomoea batatas]